ncbi:MAG: xanthine dehydrogenase family protein [Chloroflexota bacterium]|nr:xanthine dehydrogenase family protein [Chloroflexota bacterium]
MTAGWQSLLGQSLLRREDPRLLMGNGQYVTDIQAPGLLHAGILRSPHARARINGIELAGARQAPGTVLALAGGDLRDAEALPDARSRLTVRWLDRVHPRLQFPSEPLLATGEVHYAGEPVAVVVGESRYAVEDALEAIEVHYQPLPAVMDVEAASQAGSPRVHEALNDNVLFEFRVQKGDAASAMAGSSRTLRRRFRCHRNAAVPMEGRGLVAIPDIRTGALTIYSGTQTPHSLRRSVAECLSLPEGMIRVIVPDTGGGFGGKNTVYPEDILLPYLALRLGRPVKWVEDRRENLLSMTQGRDQVIDATVAFQDDGRITAVQVEQWLNCGAFEPTGPVVTYQTATHLLGPYEIEHLDFVGRSVATNKPPQAPYRGAGRPEATFVMESLVDAVARALGLDPAVVRRRNLISAARMPYNVGLPFRDGNDIVYDSGNFPELLRRVLAEAGYEGLRREQAEGRASEAASDRAAPYLGIGLACYVEATGTGPFEGASISLDAGGRLTISTGACSQGQGQEVTLAQIVGELWQVDPDRVTVLLGDTGRIDFGAGTYASRTLQLVSAAAADASLKLRQKLCRLAAGMLEANPADLQVDLQHRRVAVQGDASRAVALAELARAAAPGWGSGGPGETEPGLQATAYVAPSSQAWASAAHLAVVEVHPDTAAVQVKRYLVCHDAGKVVNPLLAEGQIVGGVAQGLGGALMEEVVHDGAGQPLSASLMDYVIPTATDVPDVELSHLETLSPLHAFGIKGLGEGGTVGAPAAIANAIADALSPLGIEVSTLPVTPRRVFELLQQAGAVPARPR